jgi:hypothetical protein
MAAKLTRLTHKTVIQLHLVQRGVTFAVLAPDCQSGNFWIHRRILGKRHPSCRCTVHGLVDSMWQANVRLKPMCELMTFFKHLMFLVRLFFLSSFKRMLVRQLKIDRSHLLANAPVLTIRNHVLISFYALCPSLNSLRIRQAVMRSRQRLKGSVTTDSVGCLTARGTWKH